MLVITEILLTISRKSSFSKTEDADFHGWVGIWGNGRTNARNFGWPGIFLRDGGSENGESLD